MRRAQLVVIVLGVISSVQATAQAQCSGGFYGGTAYYAPYSTYSYSAYSYSYPMYSQPYSYVPGSYAPSLASAYAPSAQSVRYAPAAAPAGYGAASDTLPPLRQSAYRPQTSPSDVYVESSRAPARQSSTTTVTIDLRNNAFNPRDVRVPPGTTIEWVNSSQHKHTVTSNKNLWDSGDLAPGTSYSATFHGPGTYDYYCRHHEGMRGTIVVESGSGNGPSTTAADRRNEIPRRQR